MPELVLLSNAWCKLTLFFQSFSKTFCNTLSLLRDHQSITKKLIKTIYFIVILVCLMVILQQNQNIITHSCCVNLYPGFQGANLLGLKLLEEITIIKYPLHIFVLGLVTSIKSTIGMVKQMLLLPDN